MKYFGVFLVGICLVVGACSDTKKMAPKEGRMAIISGTEVMRSAGKVRLEKSGKITDWTSSEANIHNKIPTLSLAKATPAWKIKGAEGRSKDDLPMVTPVIVENTIYILDNEANLMAFQLKDRQKLWQVTPETKYRGVGLTANKNIVISLDENGTVRAFSPKGKELWKKEFNTAFRNTPLLTDRTVFLLSFSNDLWALNVNNGAERWHYKTTATQTLLQEMARPALENNILVVPFSSGEVIGFDAKNGVLLWSQELVGKKMFDAVASLPQMSAAPVIENGIVYLVGHGGKTMAVNIQTGESLWHLERGGKTTPLISGNTFVFVDNQNHLLALDKTNGKLFWKSTLDDTLWKGPYAIDDKLILFSENKKAFIDPQNGKIIYQEGGIEGSKPALTSDGIFFLGDNGRLNHWEKI